MNKLIVEQAAQALASLNRAKRVDAPCISVVPKDKNSLVSVGHLEPDALQNNVDCRSPYCGGCYDVGENTRIHPPKIGEDYLKWLERWKPRGKMQ